MKRVWLRAAALALAVVGAVAGLTVYFSTENIPRCLVSGVATWRAPTDGRTHRYEVVILDGSACFFDLDQQQRLVGALPLSQAQWLADATPAASDTLRIRDTEHGVVYVTRRGLLGVRILDLHTKRLLYVTRFKDFTWNPRFGPDPPSHGLSLAPDRPELWVLDAPNSVVHCPPLEADLRRRESVQACVRSHRVAPAQCGRALRLRRRRGGRDRHAHA